MVDPNRCPVVNVSIGGYEKKRIDLSFPERGIKEVQALFTNVSSPLLFLKDWHISPRGYMQCYGTLSIENQAHSILLTLFPKHPLAHEIFSNAPSTSSHVEQIKANMKEVGDVMGEALQGIIHTIISKVLNPELSLTQSVAA